MSKTPTKAATKNLTPAKAVYENKDGTGTMFYDAPGAPTMTGSLKQGKTFAVTAEPAVDKKQQDFIKVTGNGISGALYVNDRKERENHPDLTGPIEIDRVQMRLAAWKKQTKTGANAGSEFLSLSVSEKKHTTVE